jgi:succinate dehydrogenase/fumarate reductase flavoprotein subunit
MDHECDLLVLGSGAGGMTAAVAARAMGLDVLLVEKASKLGGATARSGGWAWIPGNRFVKARSPSEELDAARTYIRSHAGQHYDAARVESFLANGAAMMAFMEAKTHMRFVPVDAFPDYHPEREGASQGERSIMTEPFDASVLGSDRARIAPPLPVATWAGMMVALPEVGIFQRAGRSLPAAWYVFRRLLRQGYEKLVHGQTMNLANGNALIARLFATAREQKMPVWTDAPAIHLLTEAARVTGAVVMRDGREVTVKARRGVVVATGGFPHDKVRRKALVPWANEEACWGAMPFANTGDGLNIAEAAGAHVSDAVAFPAAYGPLTPFRQAVDGLPVFPHLSGRAKPGIIAVTTDGKRFVNEANSYQDFVIGLLEATEGRDRRAYILCDARSLGKYGFGYAKPAPLPVAPYVRSGYLKRADTWGGLAVQLGINADALQHTVATFNASAARGEDPDFRRGRNRYNTIQGDADVNPNPCVAQLDRPPYFAVEVVPGILGTFAGLAADEYARVLNRTGAVIPGLYVAGNDMLSVLGGDYVGGGTTIGPAMTFGYVAARHAAEGEFMA